MLDESQLIINEVNIRLRVILIFIWFYVSPNEIKIQELLTDFTPCCNLIRILYCTIVYILLNFYNVTTKKETIFGQGAVYIMVSGRTVSNGLNLWNFNIKYCLKRFNDKINSFSLLFILNKFWQLIWSPWNVSVLVNLVTISCNIFHHFSTYFIVIWNSFFYNSIISKK